MERLEKALQSGNAKLMKKAIEELTINNVNSSFLPPSAGMGHYPVICAAVETGNVEIIKLLLDKGADVNAGLGVNGMSALYLASQEGFIDMVALLISRGNVELV